MIRRPPRSTPFPTRRSSDLVAGARAGSQGGRAGRRRHLPAREERAGRGTGRHRSEEHTSELQSHSDLVCRLLLEKKKKKKKKNKNKRQSNREQITPHET